MSIKELKEKALTNFDFEQLFEGQVHIYTYYEMTKFDTLAEAFFPYDVIFILFETAPNFGHWCVLCKDDTTNYFFDPYGFAPDAQLKFTKGKFRMKRHMYWPYLSYLLITSPKGLVYNKYRLQDLSNKSIATCGRWCILYAYLYDKMSIDEFADMFLGSRIYPDDAITIITEFA